MSEYTAPEQALDLEQFRAIALQPKLDRIIEHLELLGATSEAVRLPVPLFSLIPHRTDLLSLHGAWERDGTCADTDGDALREMDDHPVSEWMLRDPVVRQLRTTLRNAVAASRLTFIGRASANPFELARIPQEHTRIGRWAWWSSRIVLTGGAEWSDVQIVSERTLSGADVNRLRFLDMQTWAYRYPAWVEAQPDGSLRKVVGYADALELLRRRVIWQGISRDTLEVMVRGIRVYRGRGWRDADPRIRFHGE